MNMTNEPARLVSIITAFITAALGLVAAFGLNVSDDQRNAILGVIGPTVLIIGFAGEFIRARVVSPETAAKAVSDAKQMNPGSNNVPLIEVNGYKSAVADNLSLNESHLNFTKARPA